jgi:hypothetical protein
MIPIGVISHKIIMEMGNQIYRVCYPLIVNLIFNFVKICEKISLVASSYNGVVTDKMKMSDMLFGFIVLTFVILSSFEITNMLYSYFVSNTKNAINKDDFKNIEPDIITSTTKKHNYVRVEAIENIEYKLHAIDMALAKANRRIRAMERENKLYI